MVRAVFRISESETRPARLLVPHGGGRWSLVVFLRPGDDAAGLRRPLGRSSSFAYAENARQGDGVGEWGRP